MSDNLPEAGRVEAPVAPVGVGRLPATVQECISLLEQVADDRADYTTDPDDMDLELSILMLRLAADVLRTGDVRGLVPSWKWHLYGEADRG